MSDDEYEWNNLSPYQIQVIAALRRKAARWDWVETRMTQGGSPHMDGTFTYRFRSPNGRGRTVGEVIDREIEGEANG